MKSLPSNLRIDAASARRLAVEASVDPKTIIKALAGRHVRGDAGRRARDVLVRHGLLAPEPLPGRPE
jgi:hypothetical protein